MSLLGPWAGRGTHRAVRCGVGQPQQSVGSLACAMWTGSLGTQKGGGREQAGGSANDNSCSLLDASCGPGAVPTAHHLAKAPQGTAVIFVLQNSERSQGEV